MAGSRTGTIPAVCGRRLMGFDQEDEFSGEVVGSLGNLVFGFLEGSWRNGNFVDNDDKEEESENLGDVAESNDFWEEKHQILQEVLCRSSSLELRIRKAVKEAFRESYECSCKRPINGIGNCRTCLLQKVSNYLRTSGFNSALSKSKWRNSSDILAGEHTYVEVVERSTKGNVIRVIVELEFRAEFEMARESEEYKKMISRIPEVFVGKAERLMRVVKVMCTAAKKCLKEEKMHMGPWRKHNYMQAKWFGTSYVPHNSSPFICRT